MNDVAIAVRSVHKTFKLPHEKQSSIKGLFVNIFKAKRTFEKQKVLSDVSFEIQKGEFFGIVGRNGSGKSTLLKLLAGIYSPDQGAIHINGKLTPFIELGVGFNPELTGRENVFLNGALLGFNRKEMTAMYDEIVEFAELEKFMDQKLKNYSSGMQVRLAFSIAIRADTDILLIDEVLAVGDESFQNKCLEYFQNVKKSQRTVIFVTHDMSQVRRLCDRALLIENGQILAEGEPAIIADQYTTDNLKKNIEAKEKQGVSTVGVKIHQPKKRKFAYGERCTLTADWSNSTAQDSIKNIGVAIYKNTGEYIFGANTILDNVRLATHRVEYSFDCTIAPGVYYANIGLFGETDTETIEYVPKAATFIILPGKQTANWQGLKYLEHTWSA